MLIDIIKIIVGLVALILAADRLVKSAVRISRAFGVSIVLIGAVIVGFGTSIPEFVVSALASLEGQLDLAVSNVVSSNTANVTLVLGASALFYPLTSRWRILRREGALMFGSVVVLTAMVAGGWLVLWEGFVLAGLLVVAVLMMVKWSSDDPDAVLAQLEDIDEPVPEDDAVDFASWRSLVGKEILIGILALVVTVVAADFLLDGVVGVGARLGLSAVVLGLITGVGTSLPELAAGISAARHREPELVLGNVLGSNVFNSLGVVGLATILGPGSVSGITIPLLAIMVGASLLAGIFAFTGQRVNRFEGAVLLAGFLAYAVFAFQ